MMKPKLVIIAGPTAVGKTEFAIEFAKKNNGEIISLDSVQVYKGFDIGSAKPDSEQLSEVPHYMIDEILPSENINVKMFKDMAENYICDIISRGKLPVLVGGSGFYINAILYDTDFLEEDDEEVLKIRNDLYDKYEKGGIGFLRDELKKIDEVSYTTIPEGNVKRIIRAIEFYKLHSIPISQHNAIEKSRESKYDYIFYVLDMDRGLLYSRINDRVDRMIKQGLLLEVKVLIDSGYTLNNNSMNSIGYKELYNYCKCRKKIYDVTLLSESDKKELKMIIDDIKKHSRNYAKRQLTWFRSQKNITWIKK